MGKYSAMQFSVRLSVVARLLADMYENMKGNTKACAEKIPDKFVSCSSMM